MAHQVTITNTGEVFRCAEGVHVLAAMEQACCHGIPVGCRNGGCGACKVRVTAGSFETRKMNRAVISATEEADGCVLACKTYPRADIVVYAMGRVWQAAKISSSTSFSAGFAWTTSIPQPVPQPIPRPDKET